MQFVVIACAPIGTTLAAHVVTAAIIGSRLWIIVTSHWDVTSVDNAASKITKRRVGLCGVGVVVARRRDGTTNDICLSTNILGQDQEDCGEDNSHVVTFKER